MSEAPETGSNNGAAVLPDVEAAASVPSADRRSRGTRVTRTDERASFASRLHPLSAVLRTRATSLAVLLLVVGSLLLTVAHIRFYPQLSPVDELQHIDYLYKAPSLVRNGEKVGQDAMREEACRGLPNYPAPACSATAEYDPDDFQELGTNTAAIYTPLYYSLTRAVATPVQWALGLDSLVTAARLVGGLWLAGGLVMTFVVARRFGARPYPTAALLLAAAATPNVILPSATITPDAAALLAGSSLLWAVLWWEERPSRRWWLPAVVALGVVALKALNIIVVVLVALYLVLRYLQRRFWPRDEDSGGAAGTRGAGLPLRWTLVCLVVMSVVALAGAAGYVLFTQSNAVASSDGVSMAERVRADAFPYEGFVTHLGVFLQVFYAPGWWVTVPVLGPLVQNVLGVVVFAGTFAAAFLVDQVPRAARALASSLLVVGVVGAPMIIAFSFLSAGMYVPIPGRYALTLVPAGLALTASTVRRRPAQVVCVLGGLGSYGIVLAWLLVHG